MSAPLAPASPAGGRSRPAFAVRGAIEGFYGRPYTSDEREALVRFLGARGLDTYVYAPKNDPLHRERWRERYDDVGCAAFARLARVAADSGMRLLYALAPGLSYDGGDPAEFGRLEDKVAQLVDAGVAGFALLFDDIAPDSAAIAPDLQADLVARTAASLARRSPGADFWFISNYYAGTAAELASGTGTFSSLYALPARAYFEAYNRVVPPEVPILWTGPNVFSAEIGAAEAAAFRALAGRPVLIWDNFPVNDALPGRLFLGPYRGRDARLAEAIDGIVVNLMAQPAASRVPLATVADYLRDPSGYDPERSFAAAVRAIGGAEAAALGIFAEHFRGHPVLASGDQAPELARGIAGAFADAGGAEERALLERHLAEIATAAARLAGAAIDPALRAEIAPWRDKLAALAGAAAAGLDALAGRCPEARYRSLRAVAEAGAEHVACTRLPRGLTPFVAGAGEGVDRFAELFAAIDRRLAAQGTASTAET